MTTPPFEVPNDLRDFAQRSVDQARKAFEGFVTVAQKAMGAADNAAETAQQNVKSVGSQVLGFTEQNVNAALELAHKLVQAKDPQEAFAMQSEFLKTQLANLQSQAKEIGAMMQKSATPEPKWLSPHRLKNPTVPHNKDIRPWLSPRRSPPPLPRSSIRPRRRPRRL